MFKVTFLKLKDPKASDGKTTVAGRTMIGATDAQDAMKKAQEMLGKRKPEQRAEIIGVKVEKQAEGAIKWQ